MVDQKDFKRSNTERRRTEREQEMINQRMI